MGRVMVCAVIVRGELDGTTATLALSTLDGSAINTEDYVAVDSEPLLLGPVAVAGDSVCGTVPLIDDEISEPMESFSVTLESESNNTSVEGTSRARVTILDDDS
ncbi:hypothetical protein GBAR_LOCUS22440, partial [Geodia barretti]